MMHLHSNGSCQQAIASNYVAMPAGVLLHGAEEGWGLYLKRSEERPHDGSS